MCGQFSFVSRRSFAPPPCPARTRPRPPTGDRSHGWLPAVRVYLSGSALPLLVPRVGADDHDAAVPTDDPALTADLLDARLDLHGAFSTKSDPACLLLLLVPVHDPPATQVVGAELHDHAVVRQDADVVHPHFPADMGENLVPVVQLHPEEGIRERLDNRAFNLNGAVFLGHVLRASLCGDGPRRSAVWSDLTGLGGKPAPPDSRRAVLRQRDFKTGRTFLGRYRGRIREPPSAA